MSEHQVPTLAKKTTCCPWGRGRVRWSIQQMSRWMFWQLSWSHAGGRQRVVDGNEDCAKLIERKGKLALVLKQKSLSPDKGTSLLSLLVRFLLLWKGSCLQQEEPKAVLTLAACFIFRIFHSGKEDKGRCTSGLGPHVVFSSSLHTKVEIFFHIDLDRQCSLI